MFRVDLELVHYFIWVDASHVLVELSEAVLVLLEEFKECIAEVELKLYADLDLMIWKVRVDGTIIQLISAWLIGVYILNWGRL